MNCPYCGSRREPDWLTCGEGVTWGCGGALSEPAQSAPMINSTRINITTGGNVGITTAEASRMLTLTFDGRVVESTKTTRPGVPAKTFEKHIQANCAYINPKVKLARALVPALAGD